MPRTESQKHRSHGSKPRLSVKDEGSQCTICNRQFKYKRDWERHRRTHEDTRKRFQCDHCSFSAHQQSNLNTHLKIHARKKDQICTWLHVRDAGGVCSFRCTDPSSLNRHIKRHIIRAMEEGETIPEEFSDFQRRVLKREHGTTGALSLGENLHPSDTVGGANFKPSILNLEVPSVPNASPPQGSRAFHANSLHADFDFGVNLTPWVHNFSNPFTSESGSSSYYTPANSDPPPPYTGFDTEGTQLSSRLEHLHGDPAQFSFSSGPTHIDNWLSPRDFTEPKSEHNVLHSNQTNSWEELHLLMQEAALPPSALFPFSDIGYIFSHQFITNLVYPPTGQ